MEIRPEKVVLVGFCELNTARHAVRAAFADGDPLDHKLSALIDNAEGWPDPASRYEIPMPDGMHIVYALHRYKRTLPDSDWRMAQSELMLPTL